MRQFTPEQTSGRRWSHTENLALLGSGARDEPLSFGGASSLLLLYFDPSLLMLGTIREVLVYTRAS